MGALGPPQPWIRVCHICRSLRLSVSHIILTQPNKQDPLVSERVCAERYFNIKQHKVEVKHAVPRVMMMMQHDEQKGQFGEYGPGDYIDPVTGSFMSSADPYELQVQPLPLEQLKAATYPAPRSAYEPRQQAFAQALPRHTTQRSAAVDLGAPPSAPPPLPPGFNIHDRPEAPLPMPEFRASTFP